MDARIKQKGQKLLKGVLGSLGIAAGITVIYLLMDDDGTYPWQSLAYYVLYNATLSLAIWVGNGYIANHVPISWIDQPVLRFSVSLVLTVVYTVFVAGLLNIVFDYLIYHQPPLESLSELSSQYLLTVLLITFLISLFLHSREFLLRWKVSIIEAERLKQTHLSSRFESLKNQVNPHFLFNSLNVLSGLVYKDADLSARFIRHLADVYRYVLDVQDRELSELATELEALEAYLFLLSIRFGSSLDISREIDAAQAQGIFIPPLTLQMLVENAVKHNIISRSHPLRIEIGKDAQAKYLYVRNNLQRKRNVQESNGIGLANIKARYQYLSDAPVEIIEQEGTFEVRVPFIDMK